MSEAVKPVAVVPAQGGAGRAEARGPRQEFFDSLESLRGLAAFLVVLYHLPPWLDSVYRITFIRHGDLMVDFFFVLSGFVLYHSYAGKIRDRVSMSKFVALRLGRLYPVHLVFIVPFLVIEVGKYIAFSRYGVAEMQARPELSKIGGSLIWNLLLVQGLGFTSNDPSFNFPSWSISTEFYTYLVFGFGLLLFSKRGFKVLSIVLISVCVAMLAALGGRLGDFIFPLRCLSGFFIGCLTRDAFDSFRNRRFAFDWPLLVMGVVLVALGLPWSHKVGTAWWDPFFFPLAAVLIVTVVLTPHSLVNKLLMSRPVRWLGMISYSLYMAHAIVQWVARQAARKLSHQPEVVIDGYHTVRLGPAAAFVAYLAVIAVTLGLGWLSYLLVENPSRNLAKRWVAKRWPGTTVLKSAA